MLVVYTAFSAAVIHGIWSQLPLAALAAIVAADAILLGAGLMIMTLACRLFGMSQTDEVAIVFCGSQKSLVAGVPMANVLFAGSSVGIILVPIMIYHQLQLFVCAWLARRYAASTATGDDHGRQIWRPLRNRHSPMQQVTMARIQVPRKNPRAPRQ